MLGGPTEVEVYHAPYKEGPGMEESILYPLPPPPDVPTRPLTGDEGARVELLYRLLFFLATAPTKWTSLPTSPLPDLSKFRLPNGEDVACVLWNGIYHITGTDIVRALLFRFEAFGRPVKHTKKWEEGVFSDLRNLKPGVDACLEEPKSAFLDFLFRNGCIRTQKKQKVFYWFSVPHDRLFLDAVERDLKREKAGQEPTSVVVGEPARSFRYDPRRGLYEQFMGSNRGMEAAILDQVFPLQSSIASTIPPGVADLSRQSSMDPSLGYDSQGMDPSGQWIGRVSAIDPSGRPVPEFFQPPADQYNGPGGLPPFVTHEGSSAYKRKRVRSKRSSPDKSVEPGLDDEGRGERDDSVVSDIDRKRKVPGSRSSTAAPEGGSSSNSVPAKGATDEKQFVCVFEFCRRAFKRLEHLKRHIRTHTQERPFACKLCARAFSRQDNLLQHLRLHSKVDANPRGQDNDDRLSAPPYVGRRWPTQSPAPAEDMMAHVAAGNNGAQFSMPSYNNNNMAYRSTTVPPDWLSTMQPPPAYAWGGGGSTASSSVAPHPSFSPAPPTRFRSVTPQMAAATNYSYGSMPPPPAPGLMQSMNPMATAAPTSYPVYQDPHAQAQEYGFVPAASGWVDPNLGAIDAVAGGGGAGGTGGAPDDGVPSATTQDRYDLGPGGAGHDVDSSGWQAPAPAQ